MERVLEKLRVKVSKVGTQKLGFVKLIKHNTGMGLKEAKEWCDTIAENPNKYYWLSITTSSEDFKSDIDKFTDFGLIIDDKERLRQLKLISLGLGNKFDKIDIISEKLALDLYQEIRNNNTTNIYDICKRYMEEILDGVDENNIEKLFKKVNKDG